MPVATRGSVVAASDAARVLEPRSQGVFHVGCVVQSLRRMSKDVASSLLLEHSVMTYFTLDASSVVFAVQANGHCVASRDLHTDASRDVRSERGVLELRTLDL